MRDLKYRITEFEKCKCFREPAPFFNASHVLFPSSFAYPATYSIRSLAPVPGYASGSTSFTGIDISSVISSDNKYWGGVLHNNGKIYFVPLYSDNIGEFDPVTRTFSVIDISSTNSGPHQYCGGVLAHTGMIYFIPNNADNIVEFNPRTFSAIDISSTISSDDKYLGGVLGPNGMIYFVPYNTGNIGEFNPVSRTFSVIDISSTISSDAKYIDIAHA